MSCPRYPAYKDSGVEWLGEVPEHWSVIPLARTASQPGTLFVDGDWVESKDLADEGIRYITTGNVGEGKYKEQGIGYINQEKFDELRCTEVLPGDVLISRLNLPIGRACVVPDLGERIITSVDNVITRPDDGYSRSYIAYMLSSASHFANMDVLARGTTMQRISRSTLGQVRFAFPSFTEQQAITTFLDRETAKIDALVAEQEKLIELLKEKHQAVISHAVTKGLDPSVPMKDSGVEWLGEVPAHWDTSAIKYLARVGNGSTPHKDTPRYWLDAAFPWLTSTVVNQRIVRSAETFVTQAALEECHLPVIGPPAILIGITGEGKTRGMATTLEIEATINQHVAYVKPNKADIRAEFLRLFFDMAYGRMRFESDGGGSTKGAITCQQISDMRIPVPPVGEQESIAQHVARVDNQLSQLENACRQSAATLQERRHALISAAVTGQIDVR